MVVGLWLMKVECMVVLILQVDGFVVGLTYVSAVDVGTD